MIKMFSRRFLFKKFSSGQTYKTFDFPRARNVCSKQDKQPKSCSKVDFNNPDGTGLNSPSCTASVGKKGRDHYHEEVEAGVNRQIMGELNAAYAYLSMACFFGKTAVALPGTSGYFMQMFEEEIEHARIFIDYQNLRGGTVKLCPITTPEIDDWGNIVKAFEVALEMEKLVKEV